MFWVVVCHHESFDNRNCKPFKNPNIIGGAINSKNPNPTINDADMTPIIYPKLDRGVTIRSINQRRYIKPKYISCSSSSSMRVPNFAKKAPIKGTKIIRGSPIYFINKDPIKEMFKGYEKEVMEAINKIISENKGKLSNNKIYRIDGEKSKGTEINKVKRIKELKDQIDTLERKIEISQAMELSKEELQKLMEEKKKLEEELKQLENQQ